MSQTKTATLLKKKRYSDKAMLLPICSICNRVPVQGIKGVMRVGKAWLCQTCESEILQMEVGSADYKNMLEKIRSVWRLPIEKSHVF